MKGVIRASTLLVAQKKVLNSEGLELLASGADIQELVRTRPELWKPEGKPRKVRDRVVTDAFVADIVDNLIAEVSTFGDYKYHHSGTGVGAEAAGDTALGTPVEDARVVGTQVEGAANIYQSVATITYTGTHAITEHGLFNTAGAGGPPVVGGTLMDRTKFDVINVVSGNQIQYTFSITFTSGS